MADRVDIIEIFGERVVAESVTFVLANRCPRHILGLDGDPEIEDPRDNHAMLRIVAELNRLAFGDDADEDVQHVTSQRYDALLRAFPGSTLILE